MEYWNDGKLEYWSNGVLGMDNYLKRFIRWMKPGLFSWILLSLIIVLPVRSQEEGKWIQCSGEAAVQNITYEEAQVLAMRRARLDGIEKVCGVSLQAETLVKDFMLAGDFIHSISYGHIVEEKDILWETETLQPDRPDNPPIILLRATMQAKVIPVNESPDPYFKIDLKLNRTVFQSGDEVVLTVQSTKDCYLTILNLAANDSVYVLYPNRFQRNNFIKANVEKEIPSEEDRNIGFHIRVTNLPGHKRDTELVKVIATKKKNDLLNDMVYSRDFGFLGTPRVALTKMARWLSGIPVSERAEVAVMYTVQTE